MQQVAHLFHNSREHAVNIAELPDVTSAYDQVGEYDQDAVNGFSEQILDAMLDIVNPGYASNILDAMAGNGNLTLRLYDYCERRGLFPPEVTVLELSRAQCELPKRSLQRHLQKLSGVIFLLWRILKVRSHCPKTFLIR